MNTKTWMHVAHNEIPCTLYLLYMYFIVTVYSNVSIYLLYWNYYIIIPSRYILHALWIFNFWKLIIQKKMYLCDLITAFYRRKAWMLAIHFCVWSHHVKKEKNRLDMLLDVWKQNKNIVTFMVLLIGTPIQANFSLKFQCQMCNV